MSDELIIAKKLLEDGGYTLVIKKGEKLLTSKERGVNFLLELVESEADYRGSVVADKVVGKGAGLLYVLMEISELYANVLSEGAKKVLEDGKVKVYYKSKVEKIINRTGDGFCPIELATEGVENLRDAVPAIKNALAKLKNNK